MQGKEFAEYVTKRQQTLDREERAAWRDTQEMQAQADVELAKIRAEAEEKKRVNDIQIQMAHNEADRVRDQAKTEADKKLALKEMELQVQAQVNTDAKVIHLLLIEMLLSPKLPAFVDEKDELDSYLRKKVKWEKVTWAIKLSALLSGRDMDVWMYTPGCQLKC